MRQDLLRIGLGACDDEVAGGGVMRIVRAVTVRELLGLPATAIELLSIASIFDVLSALGDNLWIALSGPSKSQRKENNNETVV
jgi:hypothetical protein